MLKNSFRFALLPFLLLSACANIEMQSQRIPEKFIIIYKIQTDFTPKKCLYSSINKTVFVLEDKADVIHIYRNGKKVNTIGGLGFTSSSFNKLADITLSPDGNLLVLDSFQKKVKKFDDSGKLIAEFSLKGFIEPTLFAMADDETYYIYDNTPKEVIITRTFDKSNWFAFGKFQLKNPSKISLRKNEILIYDKRVNSTVIFGAFGQFQNELEGNIQTDKQQLYILKDHFIYHPKSGNKLAISINKWHNFSIRDYVTLLSDNEIWIGKLSYLEPEEK